MTGNERHMKLYRIFLTQDTMFTQILYSVQLIVTCTESGVHLDVVHSKVATCCQDRASVLEVPLSQFLTYIMEETGQKKST